jgi:hypothetical protein
MGGGFSGFRWKRLAQMVAIDMRVIGVPYVAIKRINGGIYL